uniref:(northern house mosquito) hypothetical protein n=1 Tax=Culex pipiens TaxID=7175 RepID=A0A8D8H0R5_CULPI
MSPFLSIFTNCLFFCLISHFIFLSVKMTQNSHSHTEFNSLSGSWIHPNPPLTYSRVVAGLMFGFVLIPRRARTDIGELFLFIFYFYFFKRSHSRERCHLS